MKTLLLKINLILLFTVFSFSFVYADNTWVQQTGAGPAIYLDITNANNGRDLAVVTRSTTTQPLGQNGYIYTSKDFGQTWVKRENAGLRQWKAIASDEGGRKLIAIQEKGFMYLSNDWGDNWQELTTAGDRYWIDVDVSGNGNYMIATSAYNEGNQGRLYLSRDNGDNWSQTNAGFRGGPQFLKASISYNGSKIVAVNPTDGLIYISTDEGDTWNVRFIDAYVNTWTIPGTPGGCLTGEAVHSNTLDGNCLNLSTGRIYKNGLSDPVSYADPLAWVNVDVSDSATSTSIIIGSGSNASKVFISRDLGETWRKINSGEVLGELLWTSFKLSRDSEKILLATRADNNVFYSKDAGLTWDTQTSLGLRNFTAVDMSSDGNKLFAVSGGTDNTDVYGGIFSTFFNINPTISNLTSSTSASNTIISWTTDLLSDSKVFYYASTSSTTAFVYSATSTLNHLIEIPASDTIASTTYNFFAVSKSIWGLVSTSTEMFFTTPSSTLASSTSNLYPTSTSSPETVINFSAVNRNSFRVDLSWDAPINKSSIKKYILLRSRDNTSNFFPIKEFSATSTSGTFHFSDVNVIQGYTYYYSVRSYDGRYYSLPADNISVIAEFMSQGCLAESDGGLDYNNAGFVTTASGTYYDVVLDPTLLGQGVNLREAYCDGDSKKPATERNFYISDVYCTFDSEEGACSKLANGAKAIGRIIVDAVWSVQKIQVVGNYAYLATFGVGSSGSGLAILNISDKENPRVASFLQSPEFLGVRDMVVRGNYAYLIGDSSDIVIVDISNPNSPEVVSSLVGHGCPNDMAVNGNFVFTVNGCSHVLGAVNLADINRPDFIQPLISTTEFVRRGPVAVRGNYAYIAGATGKITVVNVLTPLDNDTFKIVGSIANGDVEEPRSMQFVGDYLFIADSKKDSLIIEKLTSATTSILVGSLGGLDAVQLQVINNIAYVVSYPASGVVDKYGVAVIDVFDPTSPKLIKFITIKDRLPFRIFADDNYLYVTYGKELDILDAGSKKVGANRSLSSSNPKFSLSSTIQATSTISIPLGVENPKLDLSEMLVGSSSATIALPVLVTSTTSFGSVGMNFPAGITLQSASSTWDGNVSLPIITTVTLPSVTGKTRSLNTAVEVGFSGVKLSFNKGVRLLISGQAGMKAIYTRNGTDFTEITNVCSADTQAVGDALATDGDCKIDVGSDLVIWTKHFTTFATYSETTISTGGGGGGGGYVAPVTTTSSSSASTTVQINLLNSTSSPISVSKFTFTKNLAVGSNGVEVMELQKLLFSLGFLKATPNGNFGPATKQAVISFQVANKISPLGNVGPATRAVINKLGTIQNNSTQQQTIATSSAATSTSFIFVNTLQIGSRGSEVLSLQNLLSKLGLLSATPNGNFGPATKKAVMAFQKQNGITQTGMTGPVTRAQLNKNN